MKIISKGLVGAIAAGAMAVVPTAANAQYRDYDRDDGISVGDIIAGAVVIGGIAAVAGALGGRNDNYRSDDRYYRNGNYGYYNGNPRAAVQQCVNAANRDARSRGYRYAQVTQVRDVNDTNYGWKIKGNLVVDGSRGYNRRYDDRYEDRRYEDRRYDDRYNDRRYNNGYYNNSRYSAQDSGGFTCWIDRGRVSRMDYSGIRGL